MVKYFKFVHLTYGCVTSLFQRCVKYISQNRAALKIQWKKEKRKKQTAPMVPVRAHLFTSHAFFSPLGLVSMWILIYIHISPLLVALHQAIHPVGFAVCVSLHPSLIRLRLWAEETPRAQSGRSEFVLRPHVSDISAPPSDNILCAKII